MIFLKWIVDNLALVIGSFGLLLAVLDFVILMRDRAELCKVKMKFGEVAKQISNEAGGFYTEQVPGILVWIVNRGKIPLYVKNVYVSTKGGDQKIQISFGSSASIIGNSRYSLFPFILLGKRSIEGYVSIHQLKEAIGIDRNKHLRVRATVELESGKRIHVTYTKPE